MTVLVPVTLQVAEPFDDDPLIDEPEQAATSFPVRYQGCTLDAYRYDLRAFFQWAAEQSRDCSIGHFTPRPISSSGRRRRSS